MSSKVGKEEEFSPEQVAALHIRKERLYDVRWEGVPVKFTKTRDRSVPGGFKVDSHSLMPVWLRDLWPAHDFDPRDIWEKEKQKKSQTDAFPAEEKKSKSDKSKKPKPVSKKEQIQSENAKKLYEELEQKDLEKLKNASSKSQRPMLYGMKMMTDFGKLTQLLEILSDAVEARDKKTSFDVFWAIESMPLYIAGMEDDKASKTDESDKKEKKKELKEPKDKKVTKPVAAPKKSKEGQLISNYKKIIRKVIKFREEEDMIEFQLTEMADRLPPLSKFTMGWKLDQWQTRVLEVVDRQNSAIVCAPTSSGKTIISSCVATHPDMNRILFVVPTEPLVWQVSALFHKILKGNVGLCMDQMNFRPDIELRVIVGTPAPLETALAKLRGPVGDETFKKIDYAQMQGGFDFDYAIFDEVHSLDGEEGEALQRLIRGLRCNFLAMSATIGNAQQLLEWWQDVKKEQLRDVALIEAEYSLPDSSDTISADIHLEEHSGRFINLQRMVWMGNSNTFKFLHPLAAVSMEMLTHKDGCFSRVSLPFTPADTYALWQGMTEKYPSSKIVDLQPETFFARYKDAVRITLQMSKDYEDALCKRLELLGHEMPAETQILLNTFQPGPVGSTVDIATAAWDIKNKDLCPAIMFHLDSFRCLTLFKEFLASVEVGQRVKYPNYLTELQEKAEELNRLRAQAAKRRVANAKEEEEEARDFADLEPTTEFIDTAAPHPDFILSSPTSRLSNKEYDDICADLKSELKNPGHPFLRGLRRGFGIYIDDASFPKYRRVIQRLAQQGKLAFVFSDESLAYGVNMPFRTCCFCESMDGILTPLLAQQMSGRAGRRGLDTQGNLLFMNMSWPRIQNLMLGTIPAIEGREPRYPTVAMLPALSKIAPSEPFPPSRTDYKREFSSYVDDYMARCMVGQTLKQFIDGEVPAEEYMKVSTRIMQSLGFLDTRGDLDIGVSRTLCIAMWELREFLPESIAINSAVKLFLEFFVDNKPKDYGETQAVQIEFCGLLVMLIDRVPAEGNSVPLQEHSFFTKAPERSARLARYLNQIVENQGRLGGLPEEEKMRLPVQLDHPLDSRIFNIVLSNSFSCLGAIDSLTRFNITKRLRKIGSILMILHNVLMLEPPYNELELLLRKTFVRVKYIIGDSVLEESKLDDASELESKNVGVTEEK